MKKILVCGAGGFIGTHLVKKLVDLGHQVDGVDLHYPYYSDLIVDNFYVADLRNKSAVDDIVKQGYDEIYQLAADMGGAGYIFTGEHDADIVHNSILINLNVLDSARKFKIQKIFYSSSACVYPVHNQLDPDNPNCEESTAYPANPDSEYGWEKLFSERLYTSYQKNYSIQVRIARLHNVYGPLGHYDNGKEKAPAALCRKVLLANDTVDVWGPGTQTRSFLYIDDCIDGMIKIMDGAHSCPMNLGSEHKISINDLVFLIAKIANKEITIRNMPGPQGVMGRTSDNTLVSSLLSWTPQISLEHGLAKTYDWIAQQMSVKQ